MLAAPSNTNGMVAGERCQPLIALHVITPVWGERFVQDFLDVVLPLHLSANNLPTLALRPGSAYVVYTRQRDVAMFERNPSFQCIRQFVETQIRIIPEPIGVPHETMSDCFRDALTQAADDNSGFVFLAADTIIADGTIATLVGLVDAGKRCVLVAGPRLTEESFSAAIRERRDPATTAVTISPREMTTLALAHLHPISQSHFWDDNEIFNTHPSHLYWKVADEGILARCFHLHPILVRPQNRQVNFKGTIDDDYIVHACPDRETIHIVTDSDEASVFSMTPHGVMIGNELPHRSSAAYVAYWSNSFAKPEHLALAETPIYIHTGRWSPLWRTAEAASLQILSDIRTIRSRSNAYLFVFRPDLFIEKTLHGVTDASSRPLIGTLRAIQNHRTNRAELLDRIRRSDPNTSPIRVLATRLVLLARLCWTLAVGALDQAHLAIRGTMMHLTLRRTIVINRLYRWSYETIYRRILWLHQKASHLWLRVIYPHAHDLLYRKIYYGVIRRAYSVVLALGRGIRSRLHDLWTRVIYPGAHDLVYRQIYYGGIRRACEIARGIRRRIESRRATARPGTYRDADSNQANRRGEAERPSHARGL
jgi:hypothetical protein